MPDCSRRSVDPARTGRVHLRSDVASSAARVERKTPSRQASKPLSLWERGWGEGCGARERPALTRRAARVDLSRREKCRIVSWRSVDPARTERVHLRSDLASSAARVERKTPGRQPSEPLSLWERGWGEGAVRDKAPPSPDALRASTSPKGRGFNQPRGFVPFQANVVRAYCRLTPMSPRNWRGFCTRPFSQTSKCTWAPVERPVEPALAISSPTRTRSPTFTTLRELCA